MAGRGSLVVLLSSIALTLADVVLAAQEASFEVARAERVLRTSAAVVALAQEDESFTSEATRIAWVGTPFRPEGGRLVAMGVVRVAGSGNRWCRLFAFDAVGARADVVPLPPTGNPDRCIRVGPLLHVDVDGDGIPDLVHTIDVPSNRYAVTVSEAVVYRARRDRASGWCYSADASRTLMATDASSAAVLKRAAATGRRRLGVVAFSCSP